jgi:hypothetical protein
MIKYFILTLLIIGVLLFSGCKKTRENIGKILASSMRERNQDASEQSEKSRYKKKGWRPEDCFDDPKVISLCHAIIQEDVAKMERMIADGVNVNAVGKIEILFSTTNGIRHTGKKEIPLLVYALPFGENVLRCLLRHGANPNGYIITPYENQPNPLARKVRKWPVLNGTIDYSVKRVRCKNYVNILLEYGADPELDENFSPLIEAARRINSVGEPDQPLSELVTLVEFGVDLNRETDKKYAVTSAAQMHCFMNLLYLLECGAAYDPETIPGGQLQRILYKYKQEILHQDAPGQRPWQNRGGFKKVVQWLEEHGVSFDKPVPPSESTKKPEPFRVTKPKWQK